MTKLEELTKTNMELLLQEMEAITKTKLSVTMNVHDVPVEYFPQKCTIIESGKNRMLKMYQVHNVMFFSTIFRTEKKEL